MRLESEMEVVEGEAVAMPRLDRAPHRLIRVLRALRGSLPKLDHGLHRFHGLAVAWPGLVPALRGETKLRSRNSLISKVDPTQVVDFQLTPYASR